MPRQLFVFIQMEFPWLLGPADGRYLLRAGADAEPERVVVLGTLGATRADASAGGARRSPLARRSARSRDEPAEPDPTPVSTSRVTVIDPISLAAESQARAWLAELDGEREMAAATTVVNRVLHAHRIAAADPYVHEISPAQALVIRAGWGAGEQVADGRWLHARALSFGGRGRRSSRRRERSAALRPQERLAALLGGRNASLACEELTLRARLDLDHGRLEHAAIELDRALTLAVRELRGERREDLALRIDELEQLRAGVRAQAAAALGEAPPAATDASAADGASTAGTADREDAIAHALVRLESALRARTASGFNLS